MRIITRLAASAALSVIGVAGLSAPAQAQVAGDRQGATGRTVISVTFAGGSFQRTTDGSWNELDRNGRVAFRFREIGRDDWSVYLQEIGSDKLIQLDLFRMMITISQGGRPRSDLYPILSARGPMPVITPRVPAPPAPPPPPALPGYGNGGLSIGMSLIRVEHNDGYFEQQNDGSWTEFNRNGRPTYRFREIDRNPNAVTLLDASRDTRIELNLPRRMIRVSWRNGAPFEDLYAITGTRSSGGGRNDDRGGRGDDRGGGRGPGRGLGSDRGISFNVEAGPIWNQANAEQRCREVAALTNGEWTGAWRTTIQGQMSVCEIRFRQ